MRTLTNDDLTGIIGTSIAGYQIEAARVKRDCYGILLGCSKEGFYVTWQFHIEEEKPSAYWGHYFMEDGQAARKDYNDRCLDKSLATHNDVV